MFPEHKNNIKTLDIIVLGGGVGGYVAAIRAAQLGLSVSIIEKDKLGGTCLHKGCIPSKTYLRTAELFQTTNQINEYGIDIPTPPVLNWEKVTERKSSLIQSLHLGIKSLMKKNKIRVIHGWGERIRSINNSEGHKLFAISVNDEDIRARNVILATGSRPVTLGLPIDDKLFMTSDQAIERKTLLKSIIIIGGGTIGMEWASLYSDCGTDVTVIESLPQILPSEDKEISKEAYRLFHKRGIKIYTNTNVDLNGLKKHDDFIQVPIKDNDGKQAILYADALLLSVGRQPNIECVQKSDFHVEMELGFIAVNEYQQTNIDGLYAVGDVCGGGLAHVASLQGKIAVEHIAGLSPQKFNPMTIPKCTYTRPEIASIGYTEEEAKQTGFHVQIGKFPFRAIGKSLITGEFDGFAKIISDKAAGKILGVHLIGPHATDLISESGIVLGNGLDLSQWLKSIHPHPTLSEVFHEAVLAVENRAIHI